MVGPLVSLGPPFCLRQGNELGIHTVTYIHMDAYETNINSLIQCDYVIQVPDVRTLRA